VRGVYERKRKTLSERFWPKVKMAGATECWLWGKATSNGYGRIMFDGTGRLEYAHRVSFYLAHGRLPSEDTRHSCNTPLCVNPAHLVEGTRKQNMEDMVTSGRSNVGTRNPNHKLDWERVTQARAAHAQGTSARQLAMRNGVSERTMRQCLAGETWKMETGR
jgi:HNH endonuclease